MSWYKQLKAHWQLQESKSEEPSALKEDAVSNSKEKELSTQAKSDGKKDQD